MLVRQKESVKSWPWTMIKVNDSDARHSVSLVLEGHILAQSGPIKQMQMLLAILDTHSHGHFLRHKFIVQLYSTNGILIDLSFRSPCAIANCLSGNLCYYFTSAVSVAACQKNIKFNGSVAISKVESHLADARVYMLTHPKEFDVVCYFYLFDLVF